MPRLDDILKRLRRIEERALHRQDETEPGAFDRDRLRLEHDIIALQQYRFRRGVFDNMQGITLLSVLAVPVIFAGIVPMLALDLFLLLFQAVCFRAYGIPKVSRATFLVLDRADLVYLNPMEKLNCAYCGYANGLASYFREIAARTEQYWCPIKHARRAVAAHERYDSFFEYGDAEAYRMGLERLRAALAEPGDPGA